MKSDDIILRMLNEGRISAFDAHFARFLEGLSGGSNPDTLVGFALASHAIVEGDVCLDMRAVAGTRLVGESENHDVIQCPDLDTWLDKLHSSPHIGYPGDSCPLILDDHGRLYTYRYWEYEQRLIEGICDRIDSNSPLDGDLGRVGEILKRLFPDPPAVADDRAGVDRQMLATLIPLLTRFSVISGGPGTGKTTLAAKVLALLIETSNNQKLKITLASPTGKAAAGLRESIQKARETLACGDAVKDQIPDETFTIHRLLGSISGSPYFRYDGDNPLPVDILMIDEASMIDLALMSKLMQALPSTARLILMGDKDQLASVESGSVLGDICNRDSPPGFSIGLRDRIREAIGRDLIPDTIAHSNDMGLGDCIVSLDRSYRFSNTIGIGGLSRSVNQGNAGAAIDQLRDPSDTQVDWEKSKSVRTFHRKMSEQIIAGFSDYLKAEDPHDALVLLSRFRILCGVRKGPYGIEMINRLAEEALRREGLIQSDGPWYRGRPVLITRNDYDLRLFNGDTGVCWGHGNRENGDLHAFFPDAFEKLRQISIHRLPEHETAYAMTVHKSQGAEFEEVHLVFPDRDMPLLTREWVYTGMTRAREHVTFWCAEDLLRRAVSRKISRTSGLRDGLWGA